MTRTALRSSQRNNELEPLKSPDSKIPRTPVRLSLEALPPATPTDDLSLLANRSANAENEIPSPAATRNGAKKTIVEKKATVQKRTTRSVAARFSDAASALTPKSLIRMVSKTAPLASDDVMTEDEVPKAKRSSKTAPDSRVLFKQIANAPLEAPDKEEDHEEGRDEEQEEQELGDEDATGSPSETTEAPAPPPRQELQPALEEPLKPSAATTSSSIKSKKKGIVGSATSIVLEASMQLSTAAVCLTALAIFFILALSSPHSCACGDSTPADASRIAIPFSPCFCDRDALSAAVHEVASAVHDMLTDASPDSYPAGRHPETVTLEAAYDYIIVGSGTAGCTLAASLHSRKPSSSILLLESGPSEALNFGHSLIPALPPTPTRVLGGSSASSRGGGGVRGGVTEKVFDGLFPGSQWWLTHLTHAALKHNAKEHVTVESELSQKLATAVFDAPHTFTSPLAPPHTTPRGLLRSAAQRIVATAMKEKNGDKITLAANAHVNKVLFTGKEAVGVSVVRNAPMCALCSVDCRLCHFGSSPASIGTPQRISARKEVLLSAGAVGTAQLLMLSGIGPASDLKKIGVGLTADLPVGKVLRDSFVAPMEFQSKAPLSTLATNTPLNRLSYLVTRQGPLGIPPAQAIATKDQRLKAQKEASPSVHVRLLSDAASGRVLLEPTLVNPRGHGSLSLSSSDPSDPPVVSLNPSAVDDDVAALVEGVVMGDMLLKQPSLRSLVGPHASPHTLCPNPTNGVCKQYDVRHMASPAHRRSSTASVGSVVDESLRVAGGVSKLRVVDTAAAAVGCGGEDEWCSEAIALGAAELIAKEN